MKPVRILSAVLIFVPLIIAGCGGGGGTGTTPQAGGTSTDIGTTASNPAGTGGGTTTNTGGEPTGAMGGGTAETGTGGGTVNTGTSGGTVPGGTVNTGGGTTGGTTGGTGGGTTGTTPAAGVITLAWDASPAPVVGYKIYYGAASGAYNSSVDVKNVTTYSLAGLTKGQTYYIAASCYDAAGNESAYSDEINGPAK